MDIIIDTRGDSGLIKRDQLIDSDDDDDVEIKTVGELSRLIKANREHGFEFMQIVGKSSQQLNRICQKDSCIHLSYDITYVDLTRIYDADYLGIENKKQPKRKELISSKDFDLEKFEIDMGWKSRKVAFEPTEELTHIRKEINPLDKILEKSVIKSDFEQLHVVPPYELSKHQMKVHKQREKQKIGTGAAWFNMKAPQITPEIRHDLEVLRMRSALNPKHFYKKNDTKALPKYFHVGKVIDSPTDFFSSRLTKKERKKTIVDELMADAEFTKYNKRKYKEIIEEKQKTHYKAHKHARRLKGKKKK